MNTQTMTVMLDEFQEWFDKYVESLKKQHHREEAENARPLMVDAWIAAKQKEAAH